MISILLPVFNEEEANSFYIETLKFPFIDDTLFVPTESKVEILYQNIREEQLQRYPYFGVNKERFPLFRYEIKENFLVHIDHLYQKGVVIIRLISHPGGYYAKIQDPFYNTFEVVCNQFDTDCVIDPSKWEFYKRY